MDNFDIMLKEKAKTENHKIPDLLDKKIERILGDLPKKQPLRKRAIFAAVVAAAVITTSFTFVYAKDIPLINTVIEFFKGNSNLLYSGDAHTYEKYSVGVAKTINNNGVSISIDNIACDDNFLVLFYTIDGNGQKILKGEGGIPIISRLNGEIMIDGVHKSISNNDNSDAYLTDDGKVKGMIRADISGDILPKNFKVDFLVNNVLDKDGKWNFNLDVSRENAMKNSNVVKPNKEAVVKYPDGKEHDIIIEKISFAPFGNQITINEKFKSIVSKYDKENSPSPLNLFALFDDNGNALDVLNGQHISGPENARNSFEFLKANKEANQLTLVPIYTYADNADKEINYNPEVSLESFPVELKMSSKGALIVEKVEYGDTETKVYYTKKGVVLQDGNFFFVDDKDVNVFDKMSVFHKDCIIDREKGIHVSILPKLEKGKKYKLGYITDEKFDLLNQFKIEIPLN